ncbi:MAG: hypothetical protein LQ350_005323 [Teloschistes chrysophthalmus]|nr:MAG: hypothetical protein LQ350_005323 [Niorma chrysophthalma]
MPKGQKIVDWTNPDNDKKLLHVIIATSDVKVDYEKAAKAFGMLTLPMYQFFKITSDLKAGDDIPSSCIQTRLKILRKEARDKGFLPPVAASNAKEASNTPKKASKGAKSQIQTQTQDESDASETGVDVKMEGGASDEEHTKFGVKKDVKKSTKAKDDKVIAARVSKPRAKKSNPKKTAAKGTDVANDSIDHNGDTKGMTPESMTSENGHSDMKNFDEAETAEI